MAETTNRYLNLYIQSGEAQKVYDGLIAKQKKLTDELAKNPKNADALRKQLERLQEPISRAAKKISGELSPSIRETQALVNSLGNRLKRMSAEDADFSKVVKQYAEARVQLQGMKAESDKLANAQKSIGKESFLGSFFGNLAATGVAKAASAVGDFFRGTITEAIEAEETTARLKSTLDNLGRSDAFERLSAKANEMAQRFTYLDNDEVIGVFDSLITYGKLTEQQMNELLPVIVDFSAKQRISLQEGTSTIIKALEGNGKALKEYGINIKDAKTESERMDLVMGTLAEKVKGAGDTFQNTAAGGIASSRQELKNLQEEIGTDVLPALTKLLSFVSSAVKGLKGLVTATRDAISGEAAFTSSFILSTVKDNKNVQFEVESTKNIALANYKSDFELLKKLQSEGKKLNVTEQDLIAENIKGLEQKKARYEELLNKGLKSGAGFEELASSYEVVQGTSLAINELQAKLNKDVIGINQKGAGKVDNSAIKKAAEEYKKLLEDLKKIKDRLSLTNLTPFEKEVAEIELQYDELRRRATGHSDTLLQIQDFYQQEKLIVIQKYGDKEAAAWSKLNAEAQKEADENFKKNLQQLQESTTKFLSSAAETNEKIDRNRIANLELKAMQGRGRAALQAQKDLLAEQMRQELDNTELTEKEIELIKQRYRRLNWEAELAFLQQRFEDISFFANQLLSIDAAVSQAKKQQEDAELERDRKANERKKTNLERRLKAGTITQLQYDRELQKIEKEQERREKEIALKQFKRDQRQKYANGLINTAGSVLTTLERFGPPIPPNFLGIAAMAFTVASGIANLVAISKTKPPEFGDGGKLYGPSHADRSRGMPVTDPYTGRVNAYLEGGEGIVNKRTMSDNRQYQVTGTASQIISRLNGLHGVQWDTGARLQPAWMTNKPSPINFGAIKKYYALGGTFNKSSSGGSDTDAAIMQDVASALQAMNQTLQRMEQTIAVMNGTLAAGIPAYTLLSDQERQQKRMDQIRKDATG